MLSCRPYKGQNVFSVCRLFFYLLRLLAEQVELAQIFGSPFVLPIAQSSFDFNSALMRLLLPAILAIWVSTSDATSPGTDASLNNGELREKVEAEAKVF